MMTVALKLHGEANVRLARCQLPEHFAAKISMTAGPPATNLLRMSEPIPRTAAYVRFGRFLRRLGPAGPMALLATCLPMLGAVVVFAVGPGTVPWLRAHGMTGM